MGAPCVPFHFLEYGSYCTRCLLVPRVHLTNITPVGGTGALKVRHRRHFCDILRLVATPNPATKRCLAGLVSGVQASSPGRGKRRWRFRDDSTMVLSGFPSLISTLVCASATPFLANELGNLGYA
jgi:hypothetical protein